MASILKYGNFGLKFLTGTGFVRLGDIAIDYPYLLVEFDDVSYTPSLNLLYTPFRSFCTWTRESESPNVWKLEIQNWYLDNFGLYGLSYLFRPSGDSGNASLTMDCSLVGSGNFDTMIEGHYCQTFDRMFYGCTGLKYIEPIQCTTVMNVGGMFQGCTNVEEGALAQYNWFNTYGVNINNHSGTFTDCGANTASGLDELDQIPIGWGGNLVPASTLMTSSRTNEFGTYTTWEITDNAPDWTNIVGLYLFTEASVSTYAGVSMNRTCITARNSLATGTGNALYFYPAFAQYTGTSTSNRVITWLATTDTPNGNLTTSQGNTDMPGTLDYSTYGSITREYGTYDSNLGVYFLFLVTNVPIADWTGLSDAYGVLYNSNFKTDGGFRYFF